MATGIESSQLAESLTIRLRSAVRAAAIALLLGLQVQVAMADQCLAGRPPVKTDPPAPSNTTPITLLFNMVSCRIVTGATINGTLITVQTMYACVVEEAGSQPFRVAIGTLSPGTYTVHVIDQGDTPPYVACGTFIVTPAIPMFTPSLLAALAATIAALGAWVIHNGSAH